MCKSLILYFSLFFSIIFFSINGLAATLHVPYESHNRLTLNVDSLANQQEKTKDKKSKEKSQEKQQAKKPEIETVPKARKQTRPIVVKPKAIVKPIKVIKPRIKKP